MAMDSSDPNAAILGVLSISATVSTIGMFLTGIPLCVDILKRGSSEGISVVPFAMCVVSCFFWLQYGILKKDQTVILINLVGLVLELGYFAVYYYYTLSKSSLNTIATAMFTACGCLVLCLKLYSEYESTLDKVGMVCLILNVLNFASPLAVLKDVLETKSTALLPKPIILANLVVSAQWFLYGRLVSDPYIMIPNLIGIFLAALQLSLFFIYPSKRAHKK